MKAKTKGSKGNGKTNNAEAAIKAYALQGATPIDTADNIDAILGYMQIAEAGIGSVFGEDYTGNLVSGRCRILDVVRHAVQQLGKDAEARHD